MHQYDSALVTQNVSEPSVRAAQRLYILQARDFNTASVLNLTSLFCSSDITLVTAYYDLGKLSKHDRVSFKNWNSRFFALDDDMVIFTDEQTSRAIVKLRRKSNGCTILVIQSLEQSEIFGLTNWHGQHDKDPEKFRHSIELYVVWNQKSLWLEQVANVNPFSSSHFFWADSGQFRDGVFLDNHVLSGRWIHVPTFLPSCRILILSIEKFRVSELERSDAGFTHPLDSELVRLGGGNFGGDACAVCRFAELFRIQIRRYLNMSYFAGKDQPIYGSVCTSWRDMCFIVEAKRVLQATDPWFALQPVLHGDTAPVPEYVLP